MIFKNTAYRYFFSFVFIAMVPVILMSGILYGVNIANGREKTDTQALKALEQVKTRIDYASKDLSNIALYISSRYNTDVLFDGSPRSNDDILALITHYQETQFLAPRIALYGRGEKSIHIDQGKMAYHIFESRQGDQEEMKINGFFTKLNTAMASTVFSNRSIFSEGNTPRSLCFLYPLPFYDIKPGGSLLFMIEESRISLLLSDYLGDVSGISFILDPYLEPVYYHSRGMELSEDDLRLLLPQLSRKKSTAVFDLEFNGGGYTVLRTLSEDSGLTFLFLSPHNSFYKRTKLATRLFYTGLSALLLLVVTAAIILALHYYRPLDKAASLLSGDDDVDGDEWEIISRGVDRITGRNEELLSQIERQRPAIKERCLNRILFDGGGGGNFDYYLRCANIQFEGDGFCVVLLQMSSRLVEIPLLYGDVESIKPRPDLNVFGVELNGEEDLLGVILNFERGDDDDLQCRGYARKAVEIVSEHYDIEIQAGVGGCYGKLEYCANSFAEARTALAYRDVNDTDRIHSFRELSIENKENYSYPTKEQALFLQGIRHGNTSVASDALEKLMGAMESRVITPAAMGHMGYEIVSQIDRIARNKEIPFYGEERLNRISGIITLGEFGEEMNGLIGVVCDGINRKKSQAYDKLRKSIIEFINDNYCQNQISLEMVSNRFDISLSYLMRIVKDETGRSFNAYMTELRLEEAKRYLRETDLKIKDIVFRIGYMDVANFTRKFRNIEGITPGQYRTIQHYNQPSETE